MLPLPGDIKDSYADISKAKEFLGYAPKVSLKEGLRNLLNEKTVPPNHGFNQ